MKLDKWISENTESLFGKTVAVTGTTGGLGRELCRHLASLGASLVLVDRNRARSEAFRDELLKEYCGRSISCISADLEDINSVKNATLELCRISVDIFIHNAGAYSIPRHKCSTGYDNVFQINFISPYYMIRTLMPVLRERGGRVVVVGSIAHNYSRSCMDDIDFSGRKRASLVYGNAKRYLMFSLFELFKNEDMITLAVTHPGITFTNITAHYPKLIFALIKHPMKLVFMKPSFASLSILRGAFEPTEYHTWIGPRIFDVWGKPSKKRLKTCSQDESGRMAAVAEQIYNDLLSKA